MFLARAVIRSTLTAGPKLDLVAGDGRAAGEAGDDRVDLELLEDLAERGDHHVVGGAAGTAAAARSSRSREGRA